MHRSIAAVALVFLVAPVAFADWQRGDIYSRYDMNRDGKISRYEFPADPLLFDRADVDGDGMLTRSEAESFARTTTIDSELRRLDRDGDGAISRGEWRGKPEVFPRLDRNSDGVLSRADRTNGARRRHGLDRNRDGVVTRSEWRGNDASFRIKDRNGDGVLSGNELR